MVVVVRRSAGVLRAPQRALAHGRLLVREFLPVLLNSTDTLTEAEYQERVEADKAASKGGRGRKKAAAAASESSSDSDGSDASSSDDSDDEDDAPLFTLLT